MSISSFFTQVANYSSWSQNNTETTESSNEEKVQATLECYKDLLAPDSKGEHNWNTPEESTYANKLFFGDSAKLFSGDSSMENKLILSDGVSVFRLKTEDTTKTFLSKELTQIPCIRLEEQEVHQGHYVLDAKEGTVSLSKKGDKIDLIFTPNE